MIVETKQQRLSVADTDGGKEIKETIHQLEKLLKAYQEGIIIEKFDE